MFKRVEIEVTLRCNRSCKDCARLCNQFDFLPNDNTDLSLDQVERFCEQIEAHPVKLDYVRLLGGEPLLHPQIAEIIDLIRRRLLYKRRITYIYMTTNGDRLPTIKPSVLDNVYVYVSWRKSNFDSMVTAPKDTNQQLRKCRVPHGCGLGFNVWGWWPCGLACPISRLLRLPGYQRLEMPKELTDFGLLDERGNLPICKFCQWSTKRRKKSARIKQPSPAYQAAIDSWRKDDTELFLQRF